MQPAKWGAPQRHSLQAARDKGMRPNRPIPPGCREKARLLRCAAWQGTALAGATRLASIAFSRQRRRGLGIDRPNRAGNLQVALRDSLAARHTLEIAERKAGMTIMSGLDSGQFRDLRGDIRSELNHMQGLIVMNGALPIRSAGSLIGAVGVSGAPGGDKDKACAAEALEKLEERLEFAL